MSFLGDAKQLGREPLRAKNVGFSIHCLVGDFVKPPTNIIIFWLSGHLLHATEQQWSRPMSQVSCAKAESAQMTMKFEYFANSMSNSYELTSSCFHLIDQSTSWVNILASSQEMVSIGRNNKQTEYEYFLHPPERPHISHYVLVPC